MAEKKEAAGAKVKKHETSDRKSNYDKSGKAKNRFCPKCGPGIMMANHKDRRYCGKCHYMEKI
jgi:small subunit ribosomal protein S27Ae